MNKVELSVGEGSREGVQAFLLDWEREKQGEEVGENRVIMSSWMLFY